MALAAEDLTCTSPRILYNPDLMAHSIDTARLLARLDRIQALTVELAKTVDVAEQLDLSERVQREIANAKAALTDDADHTGLT